MDARIPPRDVKTITAGRAAFLLAAAVLLLGTNWPTLKIAMRGIEPLWFNAMRMLSASLVYALVLAVRGRLRWPQREDLPVVFGLGLLQFGLMSCLASYGVSLVGAGRTAILIYTNSIWVTTGAVLFLGERISRWQISGMGFGLAGIVLLFSPFDLDWNNQRILIGNGSVVLGSMIWSIALLQVRSHRWHADPLELLPHQTALGGLLSLMLAMALEGPVPVIHWAWQPVIAFAIVVLLATCLSFWGLVTAGRRLPAISVSLGQLATPVIGVASSAILVAEIPSAPDIVGLALIVIGVALAAILGRRRTVKIPS
jgi:drug/metabolite transporter (DMT)-like permease